MKSFKEKKRLLFLYTELAGYFLACLQKLSEKYDTEIHMVRWPVNSEAPFQFLFPAPWKIYAKDNFNRNDLVRLTDKISPHLVYCSGWIDKDYLAVCSRFRRKIPVVVGMDNKWKGTMRQHLAAALGSFTLKKYFSHCWVPGRRQHDFARKLGYQPKNILHGFYSCDYDFFYQQFLMNREHKKKNFPKRILYMARYYEFKGITDLWNAFTEIQSDNSNNWELWCAGTGDINPIVHPKIKHFGFVQAEKLPALIRDTGVFVLPSRFEPWGVAVQEYAAAGFPLICSDEVGAADAFLRNGHNGYIFKAGNVNDLKSVLKKVMDHSSEELLAMGEKSARLAGQITPEKWADALMQILNHTS